MKSKVYDAVINGRSDNNIKYTEFQNLIVDLGFIYQRQEGSHRVYRHPVYRISMIIQPDGNKAKGYQIKQLRLLIKKYSL